MTESITQAEIKQAFLDFCELHSPEERLHFVDKLRSKSPQLADEVVALEILMETGGSTAAGTTEVPEKGMATEFERLAEDKTDLSGSSIGRYKLLQPLGEGGMGTVYLAEQTEPVKRRVAVKVVKPGMDSGQVIARFEAERQALALMNHTNIAKVLDAGTTELGRPYFVMELVKGVPLSEYCQQEKLGINERLRLFIQLCEGIQHAHQRGIIHRDIKPSNVLVGLQDDKAVVKVIDFGIAKATQQQLTDKTLFTRLTQVVGTPLYMSPEQAELSGQDIDTRSDIYSLGVMLYLLLTDSTPFDADSLRKAGIDEVRRIIRETDPPRPSQKLSTGACASSSLLNSSQKDIRTLQIKLTNELDWIVMKALEKQRDRRYSSAVSFAEDVQRFLNDEPVLACPPSLAYRWSRFARRNRIVLTTAALVLVSLCAGLIATTWQAYRAYLAERKAQNEANVSRAIADFLQDDLLALVSPDTQLLRNIEPQPDLPVRALLDRASERIDSRFNESPSVRRELHLTLGEAYSSLGLDAEAVPHLEKAFELDRILSGGRSPKTVRIQTVLCDCLLGLSRLEEAQQILEQIAPALEQKVKLEAKAYEDLQMIRVVLSFERGEYDKAISILNELSQFCEDTHGPTGRRTLAVRGELAANYAMVGRLDEAIAIEKELLEKRLQKYDHLHPDVLQSNRDVGALLNSFGDKFEADKYLSRAYKGFRKVYEPDSQKSLECAANYAQNLSSLNRLSESQPILEETVRVANEVLGSSHETTRLAEKFLAILYSKQGNASASLELREKLLDKEARELGETNPSVITSRYEIARLKFTLDPSQQTMVEMTGTVESAEECLGLTRQNGLVLKMKNNIALELRRAKFYEQAMQLYQQVVTERTRLFGENSIGTIGARFGIAGIYQATGEDSKDLELLSELVERLNSEDREPTQLAIDIRFRLAKQILKRKDDADRYLKSTELFRRAFRDSLEITKPYTKKSRLFLEYYVAGLFTIGKTEEAIAVIETHTDRAEVLLDADQETVLELYLVVCRVLHGMKQHEQAISYFEKTYTLLDELERLQDSKTVDLLAKYSESCKEAGQLSKAVSLVQKHVNALESIVGVDEKSVNSAKNLLQGLVE